MTIVVGGYIIGYPLGGMTWHHLNYLLGLQSMGHEVWFLEDSGSFSVPYDPVRKVCDVEPVYGLNYLRETFERYGFPAGRFCYYSEFTDAHFGLTGDALHRLLERADLMICVSGVTPTRTDRPRPRRTCVIDTDPVFTQLRMRHDADFLAYYKSFDAVATFGRLIGTPACPLPTHGIKWIPTNQPICLKHWPVMTATSKRFTTIGKWEHASDRHLEFDGKKFLSSKGPGWMDVIDLPRRVNWEMDLGMAKLPDGIRARFASRGWRATDPESASLTCLTYQQFIQRSAGEFTTVKQIYSGLPSGWFSDRSAAYLASGRPVVTQSSGFDQWLPTGAGLFSFDTLDEAAGALNAVAAEYQMHATAARLIAERHFDAGAVLSDLIEQIVKTFSSIP